MQGLLSLAGENSESFGKNTIQKYITRMISLFSLLIKLQPQGCAVVNWLHLY